MTCDEDYDVDDESIESDENYDLKRTVEGILDGMELQDGESMSYRFYESDLDQTIIRTDIERSATRELRQPDTFMDGYRSYYEAASLLEDDMSPIFPSSAYSGYDVGGKKTSNGGWKGFSFYGKRPWSHDDDDEDEEDPVAKKARYW